MAIRVRLVVSPNRRDRPLSIDVRLPDLPADGDVIELEDGTRCRVYKVVTATFQSKTVSHYVYAKPIDSDNQRDLPCDRNRPGQHHVLPAVTRLATYTLTIALLAVLVLVLAGCGGGSGGGY